MVKWLIEEATPTPRLGTEGVPGESPKCAAEISPICRTNLRACRINPQLNAVLGLTRLRKRNSSTSIFEQRKNECARRVYLARLFLNSVNKNIEAKNMIFRVNPKPYVRTLPYVRTYDIPYVRTYIRTYDIPYVRTIYLTYVGMSYVRTYDIPYVRTYVRYIVRTYVR